MDHIHSSKHSIVLDAKTHRIVSATPGTNRLFGVSTLLGMSINEFVVKDQPDGCCQLPSREVLSQVSIDVGQYRYRRLMQNLGGDRFIVHIDLKMIEMSGQAYYCLSPISVERPAKNG